MRVVGIDLGTTNTVVAANGCVLTQVTEADDTPILPSAVAFLPTGARSVGTAARRRRAIDPKNTIFSAKRIIGRRIPSSQVSEFERRYPFDIVEAAPGEPGFKTRAGVVRPVDVGAIVIETALRQLGGEDLIGVITVPSAFKEEQRQATIEAGLAAGLTRVHVVDEPSATAMAYLSAENAHTGTAAVYDFGGGTFDLAIIDCQSTGFKVLASGGDAYLGGDDVDRAIADWVVDQVLREYRWDLRTDATVLDRLVVECERAKMRLCYATQTVVDLSQVDLSGPTAAAKMPIDREILTTLSAELARRSFIVCDEVLRRAGIKVRDISSVFLAGGSTLLPMVRRAVEHYFGRAPRYEFDPMEVVGIGAAQIRVG